MWGLPPLVYCLGWVGGADVGAVGSVEAQFAVGVTVGLVAGVEQSVVATAFADAIGYVGGAAGFPHHCMWWMSWWVCRQPGKRQCPASWTVMARR